MPMPPLSLRTYLSFKSNYEWLRMAPRGIGNSTKSIGIPSLSATKQVKKNGSNENNLAKSRNEKYLEVILKVRLLPYRGRLPLLLFIIRTRWMRPWCNLEINLYKLQTSTRPVSGDAQVNSNPLLWGFCWQALDETFITPYSPSRPEQKEKWHIKYSGGRERRKMVSTSGLSWWDR